MIHAVDTLLISVTLDSLLSGLIGALVGGGLSLWGALLATRRSADRAEERDRRIRESEESGRRRAVRLALRAEIEHGLGVLTRPQVSHAKIRLETAAWREHRGRVGFLSEETQRLLHVAFAEAHRYNDMCVYERHAVPVGRGTLDEAIREQAAKVHNAFHEAQSSLASET